MTRILISAVGSLGDVMPFVILGRALAGRGHDARIYAAEVFRSTAQGAGLPFVPTSSVTALQDASGAHHAPADTRAGLQQVARGISQHLLSTMKLMESDVVRGNTLLVGSTFAFSPRLLAEIEGVPFAAVHLAPSAFRSEYLAPRFSPLGHFERWPRAFKRGMWRMMDRRFLDPAFGAPMNAVREALGMPAIDRVLHNWIHEGAVALGLFPDWFAPRQPDWPNNAVLTGFPLSADAPATGRLDAELDDFLRAGSSPVVFTPGTAPADATTFFAESAAACRRLGLRAIFVTRDPAQLSMPLEPDLLAVREAPFDLLFGRACAVVHHGGIGTLSQALRAGVPQVIRPSAFDQFDNASRARRLGVARELLPRAYRGPALDRALSDLLGNDTVSRNCRLAASRISSDNGVAAAVDALEQAAA